MGMQVKLRWNNTVSVTYEATFDADDLPDGLVEHDGQNWEVVEGPAEDHEVDAFLEKYETRENEHGWEVESRFVEEPLDIVPPPQVLAPPVAVGPTSVEVTEYISLLESETEMLTPYNADEVIDLADATRKERA